MYMKASSCVFSSYLGGSKALPLPGFGLSESSGSCLYDFNLTKLFDTLLAAGLRPW